MTSRARHLDAICATLERQLDAAPKATARRLLRSQLRWVAQQLEEDSGEGLAESLGVIERIERCRSEHLASLDADDGLTVLQIDWTEVVAHASKRLAGAGTAARCSRCGARLPKRAESRCNRCGLLYRR